MRRPGWPTVFFNPGWIGLSHPYVPYKVVGDDLDGPPGPLRQAQDWGEAARWQVVEPHAVLQVADGILDLGVAAMVGLEIQGVALPVGDAGVVAVVGKQRQLGPGRGLDTVDDEPHRHSVGLTLERSVCSLGHIGGALHPVRYGRPVPSGMASMSWRRPWRWRTVMEKRTFIFRQAATMAWV